MAKNTKLGNYFWRGGQRIDLEEEDEFFTASLIYFLRQKRYRVEPYLERFRKVLKKQKRLGIN